MVALKSVVEKHLEKFLILKFSARMQNTSRFQFSKSFKILQKGENPQNLNSTCIFHLNSIWFLHQWIMEKVSVL